MMNPPSDPNRFLKPPHCVLSSTVDSFATHDPFEMNNGISGATV